MTTSSSQPKLKPTLWDAVVAAVVIVLAVVTAAAFYGGTGETGSLSAVITDHGTEVARVALDMLDAPREITVDGDYHLTITLTREGAAIIAADCPNHDCVHTGTITRAGQSIVCLPAQVVVHLEGAADSAPDVIVG